MQPTWQTDYQPCASTCIISEPTRCITTKPALTATAFSEKGHVMANSQPIGTCAAEQPLRHRKNIAGRRFGLLVAVSPCVDATGRSAWKCKCDCGSDHVVRTEFLLRKTPTTSCGCSRAAQLIRLHASKVRHGKSSSKVYTTWKSMIARCSRPNQCEYHNYGGRGIRVCKRWKSFENFYADMGEPTQDEALDRIDVNGNYEPSNCRWATQEEQDNNKRDTRRLSAFGETKLIALWARDSRCAVSLHTLRSRIRRGVADVAAITRPPISYKEAGRRGGTNGKGVPHARRLG